MNKLEKLREEFDALINNQNQSCNLTRWKLSEARGRFLDVMAEAREIERQAGIGSDTNA